MTLLSSQAQTIQRYRNTPNATVEDIAYNPQHGVFLAGRFEGVGINTGAVAVFNSGSDSPDLNFPRFYDSVHDIIPDGNGGWYLAVGGNYTPRGINENDSLNYASRKGVIHVLANNQIDPVFNFDTGDLPINWTVSVGTKLVLKGNVLYVAGSFLDARYGGYYGDGTQYSTILAANPTTGKVINFPRFFGVANIIAHGNTLYIAGYTLADSARQSLNKNVIALDLTTKALRNWTPTLGTNRVLRAELIGISNKVIIGYQGSAEGDPAGITAFDTTNGTSAASWTYQGPSNDLVTAALCADGNRVYLPVSTAVAGGKQSVVRVFNVADGTQPSDWNPDSFQFLHPSLIAVSKLRVVSNKLYVSGFFETINGQPKYRLAAINLLTKALDSWSPNPQPNTSVTNLASYQNKLVLLNQGDGIYQYKESKTLALMNPTTQELIPKAYPFLPTDPSVRFWLTKIATTGNVLWVNMGSGIAEAYYSLNVYNIDTGQKLNTRIIDIGRNGVSKMIAVDTTVYIKTGESTVNAQSRPNGMAALSTKGEVLPFSFSTTSPSGPNWPGSISDFQIVGDLMYICGNFTSINGITRRHLASLNRFTGQVTDWNPDPNSPVDVFRVTGDNVIISGYQNKIGAWQSPFGTNFSNYLINRTTGAMLYAFGTGEKATTIAAKEKFAFFAFSRDYPSICGDGKSGLAYYDTLAKGYSPCLTKGSFQNNIDVEKMAWAGNTLLFTGYWRYYNSVSGQRGGPSMMQVTFPTGFFQEQTFISSVASGNWNENATWDCGCIPSATDNVRIRNLHTVTVPTAYSGAVTSKLTLESGGRLRLNNKLRIPAQ